MGLISMNMDEKILQVPVEDIIPNRFQPRLSFDEKALNELAASIKQHGIIQPLVLRKLGDKYEIVAGERRFKASQIAGLTTVPAVISDIDDSQSAEVALIENIQRKNLTSIEEARSYKNILDRGVLTQEELAEKLGVSQSTVANKLRLLNLDEQVQDALLNEKISERHARALLVLKDKEEQVNWLNKIINDRLTVRQLDIELKKSLNVATPDEEIIPIVNDLTPNIEEIRNNALDINPQVGLHNIENMLKPSVEGEKTYEELNPLDNIDTLSLDDEETPKVEETPKNKFFNFLEDEVANMNEDTAIDDIFATPIIEESNISNEILDNNEEVNNIGLTEPNMFFNINDVEEKEEFKTQSIIDTTLNNIEENKINTEEVIEQPVYTDEFINEPVNTVVDDNIGIQIDEPIKNNNENFFDFTSNSFNTVENNVVNPQVNENLIEKVHEEVVNNDFDPMNIINTIEPGYEEKVKEENGTDLKSAIEILRKTKELLELKGFIINMEEADLGTSYNVSFNIIEEDNNNEN